LKREKILNKKATEVLPGIEKGEFDWIKEYGKVALGGVSSKFEQYSEQLGRFYEVTVYRDKPGYFVTLFRDITEQKLMEVNNKKLLEGLPYPAWLITKDRKILAQNRAGKELGEAKVGDTCWLNFHGTTTLTPQQKEYDEDSKVSLQGLYELVASAMEHGNSFDPNKEVSLRLVISSDYVLAIIEDEGNGFNWREAKNNLDIDHDGERGRGIMMSMMLCDSLLKNS